MLVQNYCKNASEKVKQVVGNVVGEVQNAFIKGRYILDGVLIEKETMDYLKIKKGKSLIFKVDTYLRTSSVSVLVNGSPSEEFGLEMDIRQGDPLSPFLFILAAEDLNVIVTEAVENGIFRGVVVGVNEGDMTDMARWMGCGIGEFPFTYLGLPIGENMRRVNAWGPVVEKFKNKLADWKAKTMSFGGRLTLVKSVLGSLPLYYFSMFRVP
ncbi:hypothetical protein Tco_0095566, partial [Tanacetum coccineum]